MKRPQLVPFCSRLDHPESPWIIWPPAWAMIVMGSTLADCGEPRQKARYEVVGASNG